MTKSINYQGSEIELTEIRFTFRDEPTVQIGVMLHDTADKFHDSDTIYGNGWRLDMINDADDVDTLITSGDGTTYWTMEGGLYHIEA